MRVTTGAHLQQALEQSEALLLYCAADRWAYVADGRSARLGQYSTTAR
jgi:hypothetical protein